MSVMKKTTAEDLALMSRNSYDTGKGSVFEDHLWDTEAVPASFSNNQLQFFKRGIGSTFLDGNKTLIETSMEDNGKLPAGQGFLAKAIEIHLCDQAPVTYDGTVSATGVAIAAAFKLLMQNSVWELKFSNSEYAWRSNGALFLPAVFLPSPGTAGDQTIGDYTHFNWIKINTNVVISEQVSFSLNASFQSGSSALLARLNDAATYLNSEKVCLRPILKGTLTRAM